MTLTLDKDNPLATKVQTRDGRKARILCVDLNSDQPIAAVYTHNDVTEYVGMFNKDGHFYPDGSRSKVDLINVPVPAVEHRRWVNWYIDEGQVPFIGGTYRSKGDADFSARRHTAARIACVEVVFKEGDGLDPGAPR